MLGLQGQGTLLFIQQDSTDLPDSMNETSMPLATMRCEQLCLQACKGLHTESTARGTAAQHVARMICCYSAPCASTAPHIGSTGRLPARAVQRSKRRRLYPHPRAHPAPLAGRHFFPAWGTGHLHVLGQRRWVWGVWNGCVDWEFGVGWEEAGWCCLQRVTCVLLVAGPFHTFPYLPWSWSWLCGSPPPPTCFAP